MGCEKAFRFHKLVSPLPTNAILQIRSQWLKDTARNDPTHSNSTAKRTIRVLTYNILANINARCSDYPNVAASILSKERRCPLIVHEILQYQADILCLQEVDFIVFETLLLPILQQYNYQGYYSGKKAESSNEGCATFWSLSTFAAVPPQDQKSFLIRDLLMRGYGPEDEEWSDVYENLWSLLLLRPDLEMVLATRLAHIAQMVPLTWSNHSSSSTIWVTNTHLYYHPQASHLRLLQMLLLTRQIAAELRQRPGELILCGDFNSSLEHSAGKLVLDRSVPANFRYSQEHLNTFRDRTWSDEDVIVEREDDFPSFSLPPSFPTLHSGVDPVPPFTHISHEFCGTLDHILYSCRGLRYQSSAPMPSISDVSTALPSPNVPSDHVSLISDLEVADLLNETSHQGATIMENIEEKA
jgi:mRNA deadenylase 3'-5' endonuclease subunit Ccr4